MTPAQPVGPDVEEPLPPGFNENMVALELRGLRPQTVLSLILGEKQEDEERGDGQAPVAGRGQKRTGSLTGGRRLCSRVVLLRETYEMNVSHRRYE